jgi:predicted nucleotidyltransferase
MISDKENIKKQIKEAIHNIDSSAEVILFGSRARGDEKPESDWDILILTDYDIDLSTENKFRNKLYELTLNTGESFSVFAFSKKQWHKKQRITPFYENVCEEGMML